MVKVVHVARRDEPTVAKSRPEFETVNEQQPASWLVVAFFVLKRAVRPRVSAFAFVTLKPAYTPRGRSHIHCNVSKARWVLSYGFSSKFHKLSSSVEILKIG